MTTYQYPPFKTDSNGNILVSLTGPITGNDIETGTTNGSTVSFKAYDVDGTAYKTFAVLTAGNTPSFNITAPSGGTIAINGATIGGVTPAAGTFSALDTNAANTWSKAQRGAFSTLTDASTVTPDFSLANNYNLTLGGSRTLGVPTNLGAGQSGVISVRQDITGSRTLAYAWSYIFPGGVAPVLSTGKLVLDQLNYMVNSYSTSTVTVTIAAPGVMTWTAHGLVSGQRIQLTTTGALPTGLAVSTTYWITVIDANTFNLSTSLANAQAATFITTTGSQSGIHTGTNVSITLTANLGIA